MRRRLILGRFASYCILILTLGSLAGFAQTTTPTISAVLPNAALPGKTVSATIKGTNLDNASAVTFSGSGVSAVLAGGGTSTSLPITITTASDAAVGLRTVRVTTPNGISAPFNSFIVSPVPVPSITPSRSSQSSAPYFGSAFQLTLKGTDFSADNQVTMNGTLPSTTFSSDTQLIANVPASSLTSAGSFEVGVIKTTDLSGNLHADIIVNSGSTPVYSYQVTIRYDSSALAVYPDNVTGGTGSGFTSKPAVINVSTPGTLILNNYTTSLAPSGTFTVAGVTFTPLAAGTTALTLSTNTQETFVTDFSGNTINSAAISLSSTSFTASPLSLLSNTTSLRVIERGDINGNRSVNIGDALVIASIVGGLTRETLPVSTGDVNLNGVVNIGDALTAAQFAGRVNVNLATPSITTASPSPVARGDTLTLTGSGFGTKSSDLQVVFATTGNFTERVTPNLQASGPNDAQSTTLTVRVPDTAISGPIQIFRLDSPAGSPQFPLNVTSTATPLYLASISPFYQVLTGTAVTLTGMGFSATPASNTVLFQSTSGTVAGTVTQATSTSLTVTVPTGALCGPVTVTVSSVTSNAKPIVIPGQPGCPLQATGLLGGGTPGQIVVIEGTGFGFVSAPDNVVRFTTTSGTAVAPVIQAGGTQLHVRIPDSAIDGPVTVSVGANTSNAVTYRASSGTVPAAIVQVGTSPASATVGSTLTLTVQVNNASGTALQGVTVSFAKTTGGGSVSAASAVTGADGRASITLTLGTAVGTNTFEASVSGITGRVTVTVNGTTGGAATDLVKISGDGQIGEAGTALTNPLVLEARDSFGNVVPGVQVAFAATGGGSVSPSGTLTTGANGRAQVNATLGSASTQQFTASAQNIANVNPAVFSATARTTATAINLVSGNSQSASGGSALPIPLKVKVVNVAGIGVPGIPVSWAAASGGGSVSASQVNTDANGEAQITATLGSAAGTQTFTASSQGLTGSPVTFTEQNTTPTATVQLVKISGDNQSSEAGTALSNALVIEARDQNSNPLAGIAVTFSVQNGGGSLSTTSAQTTGSNGRVQVSATLGPVSGTQQFLASAPNATPVLFSETATLTPSRIDAVSGTGQSAAVGLTLPVPLRIKVSNVANIGVPGLQASWAVTAGGGSVSSSQTTTSSTGEAEVSATLGPNAGTNTFTATTPNLSPVTFTAQGTQPVPNAIVVVGTPPSSATVASTVTLTFQVNDSINRPIPGITVAFAVALGGGSMSLTSAVTGSDGRVSVTATMGTVQGSNKFRAGVASVSQQAEVVITGNAGAATQLAIVSGSNQAGGTGATLANPLIVAARDTYGNLVPGVSVTFAPGTGGGSVNPATAQLTNSLGRVQVTATLGPTPGLNTFNATSQGLNPVSFSATATTNPIAWYSFDTQGQVGKDSIGTNDGAPTNVTQVTGIRGLAANFTNGYIQLPTSSTFNLRGADFTMSVFVKGSPGNGNWFAKSAGGTHRYGLAGSTVPSFGLSAGSEGLVTGATNVFDGNWHHVAGVRRGSQIEIWVDGHLEGTAAVASTFSSGSDTGSFAIGRLGECCESFNGQMDEAKIWPRALTSAEIGVESGLPAAPTLTSISPNSGIQGSTIIATLSGTGFVAGNTTVTASGTGVLVSHVDVTSSISLQVTLVLAGLPGTRGITVITPGGTSGTIPLTVSANALSTATTLNVTTIYGTAGQAGAVDATGTSTRFNAPIGVWGDGSNIYVADFYNHIIRKVSLATGAATTLAGVAGSSGSADGAGLNARFNLPMQLWGDGVNLYVAEYGNRTIRKIVIATGVVTTVAGQADASGSNDGIGTAARFARPMGIWGDGKNLYIAEYENFTIRRLNLSTLAVSTIAGQVGVAGTADGIGTAARFNGPRGLWGDGSSLYIADELNHNIRKLDLSSNMVTTLAGQSIGSADGVGAAAQFRYPQNLWGDGTNLYIEDLNQTVRKLVIGTASVSTLAGLPVNIGSSDGLGPAARFNYPQGIWGDGASLYAADTANHTIRKLEPNATQLLKVSGDGQTGEAGTVLPGPLVVEVRNASGIAVSGVAVTFSVTSGGGSVSVTAAQTTGTDGRAQVTATLGPQTGTHTFTASSTGLPSVVFAATSRITASIITIVSGNNQSAQISTPLNAPLKVHVTNAGNLPIANVAINWAVASGGGSISQTQTTTDANGDTQITATVGAVAGTNTFTATNASLTGSPLTFTATGTPPPANPPTLSSMSVTSGIQGASVLTTLTGTNFTVGTSSLSISGTGVLASRLTVLNPTTAEALLVLPGATGSRTISVVTPNGTSNTLSFSVNANSLSSQNSMLVSTAFGSAGIADYVDATGTASRFTLPNAVWGDSNSIYVTESVGTIRKIQLGTGAVSTQAGQQYQQDSLDGSGTNAHFGLPGGIWSDGNNVYVADTGHDTIRKIVLATGVVSTIAGQVDTPGFTNGTGNAALFDQPAGLWGDGVNLYIADQNNSTIRRMNLTTLAVDTIAGQAGLIGNADGFDIHARFNRPSGLWGDGVNLYIADQSNHRIRVLNLSNNGVSTFAGQALGTSDGIGTAAQFNQPSFLWGDGVNLYVTDQSHRVRKIALSTATVISVAGQASVAGTANGLANIAQFNQPSGIWGDGNNLYVADYGNHTVRKLTSPSTISWIGGDASGPTDWSKPGNWSPAQVPTRNDNVVIPIRPNQPVLSADSNALNLTVQTGARLNTGDAPLNVYGNLDVTGSITKSSFGRVVMLGPASTIRGLVPDLYIEPGNLGYVTLIGNVTVTGDVSIGNFGRRLVLNGKTMTVSGSFGGDHGLDMQNAADHLVVNGGLYGSFGSSQPQGGRLTNGLIEVANDFCIYYEFNASGSHKVLLNGSTQQKISDCGDSATKFQDLEFANPVGVSNQRAVSYTNKVTVNGNWTLSAGTYSGLGSAALTATLDIKGNATTLSGTTVAPETSLWVGGALSASGTFTPNSVRFTGVSQTIPSGLPYKSLEIGGSGTPVFPGPVTADSFWMTSSANVSLAGPFTVNGSAYMYGGSITLNGQTMTVNGAEFYIQGGHIIMQNSADRFISKGTTKFNYEDNNGSLQTAGVIEVGGDLKFYSNFMASGNHKVRLNGTARQSIESTSGFQTLLDLEIANPVEVSFVSSTEISVSRNLTVSSTGVLSGDLGTIHVAGNVNTVSGSTVTIGAIDVAGTLSASGTFSPFKVRFTGDSQTIPAGLAYKQLEWRGSGSVVLPSPLTLTALYIGASGTDPSLTLSGPVTVTGNVWMFYPGGKLVLNGQTLTVQGDVFLDGRGRVVMQNAADRLTISGNATFTGDDEQGFLSAGTVEVKGNVDTKGFAASGSHTFRFNGTAQQTVIRENTTDNFQNVEITNAAGAKLLSNVRVTGTLTGSFILNGFQVLP